MKTKVKKVLLNLITFLYYLVLPFKFEFNEIYNKWIWTKSALLIKHITSFVSIKKPSDLIKYKVIISQCTYYISRKYGSNNLCKFKENININVELYTLSAMLYWCTFYIYSYNNLLTKVTQ